eukprot:gene10009-10076_t
MLDNPKLTARQQQILDLIQTAIARTGAPPTRAEIAAELGFKSANAAEEHLQALARKGVIELVSGTSRGIRLRGDTVRSINAARGNQFSLPIPGLSQLVLPLVGRVAAGSPILAQEHVDQTYSVENSLFQHKPDYLLKVRGMSMRDAGIMDGDLLAVQSTREARNGQIIVARLGDDVTVKRLRRTTTAIELLPENPDYPVIVVQPGEPFEIEGLAVGLIRNTMGCTVGGGRLVNGYNRFTSPAVQVPLNVKASQAMLDGSAEQLAALSRDQLALRLSALVFDHFAILPMFNPRLSDLKKLLANPASAPKDRLDLQALPVGMRRARPGNAPASASRSDDAQALVPSNSTEPLAQRPLRGNWPFTAKPPARTPESPTRPSATHRSFLPTHMAGSKRQAFLASVGADNCPPQSTRVLRRASDTGTCRLVIAGRMADVCAELDRLAASEALRA